MQMPIRYKTVDGIKACVRRAIEIRATWNHNHEHLGFRRRCRLLAFHHIFSGAGRLWEPLTKRYGPIGIPSKESRLPLWLSSFQSAFAGIDLRVHLLLATEIRLGFKVKLSFFREQRSGAPAPARPDPLHFTHRIWKKQAAAGDTPQVQFGGQRSWIVVHARRVCGAQYYVL